MSDTHPKQKLKGEGNMALFERIDKKVDPSHKMDKVAKKLTEEEFNELTEDDIEEISGGFRQKRDIGYSGGLWINCAACGIADEKAIKLLRIDDSEGIDVYHCNKCGFDFGIGPDGQFYYMDDPVGPQPMDAAYI